MHIDFLTEAKEAGLPSRRRIEMDPQSVSTGEDVGSSPNLM